MSVRDSLDKIENLVVGAQHFPFTDKTLINDNELIHYVDELRNDLPKELNRADEIMAERDQIISDARKEAERITEEAKAYAKRATEETEIVRKSREEAESIMSEARKQSEAMLDRKSVV